MRKFILLFSAFMFISCGLKQQEQYGIITITIPASNTGRAVNADGLPDLSSTPLILSAADYDSKAVIHKAAIKNGTAVLKLPVGKKIILTVQVKAAAAIWEAEKIHTVNAGNNKISLKLSKKASIFTNFLFSSVYIKKDYKHNFSLSFEGADSAGSLQFENINGQEQPNITRDSLGRTYFYSSLHTQTYSYIFKRYTCEGEEDRKFTSIAESLDFSTSDARITAMTADFVTGDVYFMSRKKLKVLKKEDGAEKVIDINWQKFPSYFLDNVMCFGAHNGKLFFIENRPNDNGYTINEAEIKNTATGHELSILKNSPTIEFPVLGAELPPANKKFAKPRDIFIKTGENGDEIYILFANYHNSSDAIKVSGGGIIKLGFEGSEIKEKERYGFTKAKPDSYRIIETGEENFYGAVKVIGYENGMLYAADDGVKFEYKNGKISITANKNRIAALNLKNGQLSFREAPAEVQWFSESEVK